MKNLFIITAAAFFLASCNNTKQSATSLTKQMTGNQIELDKSESYVLFKNNCYACHSVTSKSHDEIIAPPMVAVKRRYKMTYSSKEDFVNAVVNWSKDPKEENALMFGAVQQFKVMPKQAFKEDDLQKIADYIYENKIEQPKWFEAHFKEEHGANGMGGGKGRGMGQGRGAGQGKGMGLQGQNNWKQRMSLDNDKKWVANTETTQGIEKLQEILKNDKSQTVEDFGKLEKKLSNEITTILDKCTMKGASHDNLHIFLLPLIKKVDRLKELTSFNQGKMIATNIRLHLEEYHNFFK